MSRYVALLRGVNLGRHQRIAMADLHRLLTGLGHTDVATYLQSGNAVFTSADTEPDRLAADIQRALAAELGLSVPCLVRGRDELRRVVDANPFGDVAIDPARLLVIFLSHRPGSGMLSGVAPETYAPERFAVGDREIYVWCPEGVRNLKLSHSFFEKRIGCVATARNWNTVTNLLRRMDLD